MRIILDGKAYEFDADWLVNLSQEAIRAKVDPRSPDVLPPDVRLAAKGMLRFHLNKLLQMFAEVLGVEDWHTLKPGKGDDVLVVLHELTIQMVRAEMQNMTVELTSVGALEAEHGYITDGVTGGTGGQSATRLALTGAALGPLRLSDEHLIKQLGERPGQQPNSEPAPAALPEASGA